VPGASISVKIDDREVKALLGRIQRRLADLTPAMKIIGSTIQASVVRNFEVGGRPKWKPLSRVTLKRRKKGGGILRVQGMAGGLMGSIHYRAHNDRVIIGTNKIYAGTHQFGARKGSFGTIVASVREHMRRGHMVRAHTRRMAVPWGDIPARPFLMVQDEDWSEIREALNDFIVRRK